MVGSLLITFDERINGRGGGYFNVTVNGETRNTHFTDINRLYSTDLFIGDVCTVCVYQPNGGQTIGVIRKDYTTDDQGGDRGIVDNTITNQTGGENLCVTFTATTVSNAYNFEYRLDLSYIEPTPTPTPTPLPVFYIGVGPNDAIYDIVCIGDGDVYIGGKFTQYNNQPVNRLARLNSSGELDTGFIDNTIFNATSFVRDIELQSDGKILVSSLQNLIGNMGLTRFNTDGTIDTSFRTNLGSGFTGTGQVRKSKVQSDGKIIVGGDFDEFNGNLQQALIRLNSDGTYDTSFIGGSGFGSTASVNDLAIQSDGKIMVAGDFTSFDGVTSGDLVRVNTDGTIDVSFVSSGFTKTGTTEFDVEVNVVELQPDGKILVGGNFDTYGGVFVRYPIVRLTSTGAIDTIFTEDDITANVADMVYEIKYNTLTDQIWVGGYSPPSFLYEIVQIFNLDGTATELLYQGYEVARQAIISPFMTEVRSIDFCIGDKIYLGGSAGWNALDSVPGVTYANNLTRVNSNGSLDTSIMYPFPTITPTPTITATPTVTPTPSPTPSPTPTLTSTPTPTGTASPTPTPTPTLTGGTAFYQFDIALVSPGVVNTFNVYKGGVLYSSITRMYFTPSDGQQIKFERTGPAFNYSGLELGLGSTKRCCNNLTSIILCDTWINNTSKFSDGFNYAKWFVKGNCSSPPPLNCTTC